MLAEMFLGQWPDAENDSENVSRAECISERFNKKDQGLNRGKLSRYATANH